MSWETGGEGDCFRADSDLYWGYAACGTGTCKRRGRTRLRVSAGVNGNARGRSEKKGGIV